MKRETRTAADQRGGCFVCHESLAKWFGKNAVALAAKHHDKTGHATWAEQNLSIWYGREAHAEVS